MRIRNILSVIAITAILATFGYAQDEKDKEKKDNILGEVTVNAKNANSDPIYKEFRNLSDDSNAFSGPYARVNNLVLKKDAAVFTFKSGEIYFLKEAQGKRTGAVFFGDGELSIIPPVKHERRNLEYFTKSPELKENFDQLVMFFTDTTFEDVKNSPNVEMSTNGAQSGKAKDAFAAKESLMKNVRRTRYNMTTRILMDKYAPKRRGFFWGYINGKKYSSLLFKLDPLGVTNVYPEQVSLTNYDPNNFNILLAFHLKEEYDKGTGNSGSDRRVFDITKHNIDATLRGLRIIATDEVSLKVLVKGQRVLPFNLFPYMRVKRILDQNGEEVNFIQENPNKDGSLAVILPKPPKKGEELKLSIEYDGAKSIVALGTGNYILVTRSNWYPNNGSGGFSDRATYEIRFRYPKTNVLIGVGELIDATVEDDLKVEQWSTKGVEMKVAGFNYGDFKMQQINDKASGYELSVYNNRENPEFIKEWLNRIELIESRRANRGQSALMVNAGSVNTSSRAKKVLDDTINSVRLFNAYFGKLPHKRIAMTEQQTSGGQAWATLIYMPYQAFLSRVHLNEMYGSRRANSPFYDVVGPHEVAHQWFGHTIGWKSYRDQWMSEGFSHLSASIFIQYAFRDTPRFIKFWEDQRKLTTQGGPGTFGIKPYSVGPVTQGYRLNTPKTGGIAQRLIYPKGAYILHMIRMMMINPKARGLDKDKRFRAMMLDFIKTHYNKDISTEDFKRAVEKHMTPQMDLYRNGKMDWFFDQWVYGTDVPKYEMEYQLTKSNGQTILNAKITQSEVSDSFVTPVPVYVDYGKGWVELGKATIVGNKTYELKNIPLPRRPKKVAVLALNDVLATKVSNKKVR